MATFTWSIDQIKRTTSDDAVVIAHWCCVGVEGDNSRRINGTAVFSPDPTSADFIPFNDLTEAVVLGWVHADVTQADVEATLQSQLDEITSPRVVSGMPWDPS
jgi:hypothetical protein